MNQSSIFTGPYHSSRHFPAEEIRFRFFIHRVRQFIDRPRQCRKYHKFTHYEVKCNIENKICVTCGESHERACSSPIICANCKSAHRADFNQCPVRITEIDFLIFKCNQHLTFTETRRDGIPRRKNQILTRKQPASHSLKQRIFRNISIRELITTWFKF